MERKENHYFIAFFVQKSVTYIETGIQVYLPTALT